MIAVLKTKGVPIVWVGLPAVRGPKATSDMLLLDSLYREAANKAGITYVDVWDGFVDEGGRFMQRGPDFEGQPRKLRSDDGVYFTTAGARKLAHYVDREIERVLANRSVPIALPNEPGLPDTNVRPGVPAPRPLAGPIVPLTDAAVESDALLGGPGSRPAQVDPLAQRTLVKGEPLPQLVAGRADDYVWPRRDIGPLDASTVPTATTAPDAAAPGGKQQQQVLLPQQQPPPLQKKRPAPPPQNPNQNPNAGAGSGPGFFSLFRRPVQQPQVQPPQFGPRPLQLGRPRRRARPATSTAPPPSPRPASRGSFSRTHDVMAHPPLRSEAQRGRGTMRSSLERAKHGGGGARQYASSPSREAQHAPTTMLAHGPPPPFHGGGCARAAMSVASGLPSPAISLYSPAKTQAARRKPCPSPSARCIRCSPARSPASTSQSRSPRKKSPRSRPAWTGTRCWCSTTRHITDEQQMAFSQNFGPLEDARGGNVTKPEDKRLGTGMNDVSNLGKDGKPLARDSRQRLFNLGNMLWHSDSLVPRDPGEVLAAVGARGQQEGRQHRVRRHARGLRRARRRDQSRDRGPRLRALADVFARLARLLGLHRRGAARCSSRCASAWCARIR